MILNQSKCHLLVCSHKDECVSTNIDNTCNWEESFAKLLGILIVTDLSSKSHLYKGELHETCTCPVRYQANFKH